MNTAKDHYDRQLASVYSWMAGTPEAAIQRHHDFLRQLGVNSSKGLAIDLGAGSGFQSIPLAEFGFSVVAVDFCEALLSELSARAGNLPIRTIHDNILNFSKYKRSSEDSRSPTAGGTPSQTWFTLCGRKIRAAHALPLQKFDAGEDCCTVCVRIQRSNELLHSRLPTVG